MSLFFTQFIFFLANSRDTTYLNVSSGQISTPKFGLKNYPANFNWQWYLLAPEGHQIQIKFESFELEQSEHCQNDYLEIREAYSQHPNFPVPIEGVFGAVLARPMCGNNLPSEIHSARNMVWVHFQSDSNDTTTYKGFKATFTSSKCSPSLRYYMTERIAKRGRITPLSRSCQFGFERRLDGHQNCKMANVHCCVPLCNNDKQYDSGKDLFHFNFPRDMQERKRMPPLEYIIYLEYIRNWFEPRSNIPWLKKIIWVIGVLRRTVVSD